MLGNFSVSKTATFAVVYFVVVSSSSGISRFPIARILLVRWLFVFFCSMIVTWCRILLLLISLSWWWSWNRTTLVTLDFGWKHGGESIETRLLRTCRWVKWLWYFHLDESTSFWRVIVAVSNIETLFLFITKISI